MEMMMALLMLLIISFGSSFFIEPKSPFRQQPLRSTLNATPTELLKSRGYYFDLSDDKRTIAFGETVNLRAQLPCGKTGELDNFIRDPIRVASVIWSADKMEKVDSGAASVVYRLQLMRLNFLAIVLSPWVDLKMISKEMQGRPQFMMESIGFDPQISVLRSNITPESLAINIKVAGIMKASPESDQTLVGLVGFRTTGKLPLPLRIVPKRAISKSCELICRTIVASLKKTYVAKVATEFKEFQRRN